MIRSIINTFIFRSKRLLFDFRNIMRILKTNKDGHAYFANMTFLFLTYFVVRILPLPFVLHLFASKSYSIVCGDSILENLGCTLQAFTEIPTKCQLGCLVFYALQLYWFLNICRNWLQITLKKISQFNLYSEQIVDDTSRSNPKNNNLQQMKNKYS